MLTVTRAAAAQLISSLQSTGHRFVRFGVSGGGCHGLQYEFSKISAPEEGSSLIALDDDHSIELCQKSEVFVFNTHIDWDESIMGNRFVFSNPQSSASCGCGKTFSVT